MTDEELEQALETLAKEQEELQQAQDWNRQERDELQRLRESLNMVEEDLKKKGMELDSKEAAHNTRREAVEHAYYEHIKPHLEKDHADILEKLSGVALDTAHKTEEVIFR